jgi:hypothetical protein
MTPRQRRACAIGGVAAVFGVYAFFAVYCHQWAAMAPDESFYAVAAHDVYDGRALYRDLAYTQMPLYPYIDGLILKVAGTTLFAHRIVNAVWGALTLLAVLWIVYHRTRELEPTLFAGFLLGAAPRWVSLQALAVWCAPSGAFLAAALAAALYRGPYWRRAIAFAIAAALACGCRLTCAPIVAVMWLLFLAEGGARRGLLTAALVAAACALPAVPFLVAAPERFLFDVWGYHVSSARERNVRIQIGQWWNLAPAVITSFAVALLAVPRLVRARARTELILLGVGLVGLVVPVLPPAAWGVYAAASVPVAAVATAIVFQGFTERRSSLRLTAWTFLILPLFVVLAPMTERPPSDEVAEMAAFLRREVPPGSLLTSLGVVAVEAGRPLVPNTEMGPFSAMAVGDGALAARTGFTTLPELTRRVRAREPAAVLLVAAPESNLSWNFGWAVPRMENQDEDDVDAFNAAVDACYESAHKTDTMELLLRKDRCGAAAKE